MWNQWSAGPPPMPPPSTANPQPPLIGPVLPNPAAPTASDLTPLTSSGPESQSTTYPSSSGAPSYTPAQYAAMTPEQQYAVQQHWQQWQAYEQQYAQWHAQYGEQYKREMAAIHGAPPPTIRQYDATSVQASVANSFAYPPPIVSNAYQVPMAPAHAPPPPPPDDKMNVMGIKAPPQIYEQPPPPPPPPQQEEKHLNKSLSSHQFQNVPAAQRGNMQASQLIQVQENRWSQPPPPMQSQGSIRNVLAQNLSGQQDSQQQNPLNQQFNNNNQRGNQRDQQRDEQGRDNRQINRHNSEYRGRTRGRGGNNFENNRQQQFDSSEGRNHQLQSESLGQKSSRGSFNNRFDNYESHNKNMDQRSQQGIPGWNNSSHGIDNQTQQQNLQNQTSPIENSQNNIKINSGSVDEKAFDEQFRLWEEQFENWKKENANHPDRTMYMQYEREFEKTRIRLLERREQMRRRKMMELQQLMQQEPKHQKQERECLEKEIDQQKSDHEEVDLKEQDNISESKQVESSDMEQSEIEDTGLEASKKQTELITESSIKIESNDTNIFKNNEISDLFKTASGIPGLDLVGSKGDDKNANPFIGVLDSEIIDLDNEGPSRPAKLAATSCSSATLSRSTVQQAAIKPVIPNIGTRQPSFTISQTQKRKIPSLFDIVVEKPILSPENDNRDLIRDPSPAGSRSPKTDITSGVVDSRSRSISNDRDVLGSPGQRPLSQMSQRQQIIQTNSEGSHDLKIHHPFSNQELQQPANIPPEAADLAKALQDPNVMQLLTVALAQAQQAEGINQSGNLQQNQLLQQLQQLQPLIQMQQQERNSNHQPWNHSQTYRPQSWQSQSQNSNIKVTSNSNQNRNSWSSNPFNKNNDRLSLSREPGSNNESENNNNMQQRNPHNPFRRNVGGCGSDDNSGGNRNLIGDFEGPVGNGSFNNNNFQSLSGLFGVPVSAQQKRGGNFGGGGRFNDDRPHSNFGISAGFRNNPNNFGDRGGDDNDYYRPAQVFDYQNRSRADIIVPLAKVVDYGHRPSAVMSTNSFNRDNSEFVPVKTIDYGHASNSAQNENQFQQTNMRLKNKVNTSDEDQQSNQGWEQSKGQTQFIKTKSQAKKESQEQRKSREKEVDTETPDKLQNKRIPFQTKEQNRQNKQQEKRNPNKIITQINKVLDDKNNEATQSVENENVNELDDENLTQYPNNKWVLQNTDGRRRPGPPTKRGKRYSVHFQTKQKCPPQDADNECDEIEENFEEISDNEDLNDIHDIPPPSIQCKEKSRPLFPSVSDSVANASIIFPSMENNNTIPIDEILFNPGRLTRPKNIVIIIRGPPGSGKSHVAKLIKDKEVEMGGATPRLLSIDDYFMIENDYEEKCPKTGRKIPKKEILYEYEKEMEGTYMQYLIKSFKKTVTDHLFDFIIVDCCNHSLRTFNEFYNAARDGNFSPFIVDMICDADICLNQNIHNRKEDEIKDIIKNYQDCPGHYIKLDVSNLLENVVEMEDVSDLEDNFAADSEVLDLDEDDEPKDSKGGGFLKSKWDTDPTTENLARLDGTSKPISKRGTATLEEYLQIDGWELPSSTTNGKKRVRWADIEEKRAQDKMRAIGFVVGQTDWNRMMDPTSGSGALTKTKYIERLNKRR